ncbi:hypothetical protein H6503_03235 [Candidatus Woesearchaeota archaeon]|nr:hypothetical protein [Candidatus Woesearchaeota archaeon]
MRKKVYGESRKDTCYFCEKQAFGENSQGLPACKDHVSEILEDKRCTCGEYLDIKKSKWGAFFVCSNCGPISLSKSQNMDGSGFKLNKKYRNEGKPKLQYEKGRVYHMHELEALWDKE